ncbi:hypothetical protein Tco_0152131 [Tanacetum coccineum]
MLPIPLPAPSTSRKADIPEADTLPRKRLLLTTPRPRCEVGESSVVAAARQPGPTMAHRVDYSLVDTMETSRDSSEFYSRHHDAQKDRAVMRAEIEVLRRERLAYEQESMETRQALARSEAYCRALEARVAVLETEVVDKDVTLFIILCHQLDFPVLLRSRPIDLESARNNALAKLPLLKQGDYDTWRLRIKSYIQLQDYALWEIIEDGNSFKPVARTTTNADGTSTSTIPGAVTVEEKIQKKNDLKAQSILMRTLPSEHLLTFNQYKEAKTLFKAIEARFGGNEATKKTQKTLLKQMYENFNASSSESLDSIFTQLQKIVSQLAILGENISQEDLNFKFLRSLPSEWSMHVVVWRNKPDLGSISFDDLYNNFKIVEQEVKRSVISSSNLSSHNVAFVSTSSSTNDVNTSNVHASTTDNTARLSDATIYAFLANQPNGSQVVHEDLEQIHEDDLEEMDLKWQLALLSMKARKFHQRTGKKIIINRSDIAGYDKTKVECFNCHKMGYFVREGRNPRSQENRSRNQDSSRRTMNVEESSSKAMLAIDGVGFDWSFMTEEEVPTNFALMAFSDSEVHNNKTCSKTCLKSFEDLKSQYDNLRIELNKSEFDLANYKRGLASVEEQLVFYKKNEGMLCDQIAVLKRDASFNYQNLDKLIGSQISDNNRKRVGYNVVAPLPTGLFAPPTIDLSTSGLEEFKQPEFEGYGLSLVVPLIKFGDEDVHKELDDRMERAATTASSLEAEQDSDAQTRFEAASKSPMIHLSQEVTHLEVGRSFDQERKEADDIDWSKIVEQAQERQSGLIIRYQALKKKPVTVAQASGSEPFQEQSTEEPKKVGDEAVHKELGDRMERAATTASSLEAKQDSGGYTPGCDEGRKKLNELTELCTKLSEKVTSLEQDLKQTKQVYGKALTKLVKKVKHLEDQLKSTTKRRKAKVVISHEEEDLVSKDPSKQGRMSKTKYVDGNPEIELEDSVRLNSLEDKKVKESKKDLVIKQL